MTAAALPADTARLMPTPVIRDRLRNVDTKLPLWLATPMRPGRGIRGDDLCAQRDRRADDALAVGAGEQDAEFVGERDEFLLGHPPRVARLAVPGGGQEGRPDALAGAGAEQIRIGRRRRADEHQVDLAVGQVVDVGDRPDAEHLLTLEVRPVHTARVPAGEQVVQRHEPELARVARCAGHEHPSWFEQGPELGVGRRRRAVGRVVRPAVRRRRQFDERVDGDRRRRRCRRSTG